MSAGSDLKLAKKIASEVVGEGYEGMSTDEIRMRVYLKLKKISVECAQRYVYRSNMKVRTSRASLDNFETERIIKSLCSETKVNKSFAQKIAKEVEKELGRMKLNYVTAPLIREITNVKLLENGMESVRARYTRLGMPVHDVSLLLENEFTGIAQYSPEAVYKVMSDQIGREYALINILPIDLADAHMSGQIHIHDLNYFPLKPTTFSHDLRFFLQRGLKADGTGEYTAISGPAKRPPAAFMHALKVLIAGQTECSREQIIEDFNYILAPYIQGLEYEEVKQLVQMLFYEISQTSVGKAGQSIYATFVLDTCLPKHLMDLPAVLPGGKTLKTTTYSDYQDEAETLFKAVADVSHYGDYLGKPFIYPKLIMNCDKNSPYELIEKMTRLTHDFGSPYYMHGIKPFYGVRRGTIQHVTVNLPQIGYQKTRDIWEVLDNRMKKAMEILLLKKKVMNKNIESNILPFMKQKAAGLRYYNPKKQQYVISYAGLEELVKIKTGGGLTSRDGLRFGLKVIRFMEKMRKTFAKESGLDIILTGDPKGTSYSKFAAIDRHNYPDKFSGLGGDTPFYSKGHTVNCPDLKQKIETEMKFSKCVNGRTTTHIILSPLKYSIAEVTDFVKNMICNKKVKYLSVSKVLTICSKCGTTTYKPLKRCDKCRSTKTGVWARDTGHIQNIKQWTPNQLKAYSMQYRYNMQGEGSLMPQKQIKNLFGR